MLYIFVPTPDLPNVPKENVLEACTQYFKKCVDLVFQINSSEDQLSKRWKIIRQTQAVEPAIQNIFEKYLGKIVAAPDDIN